MSPDSQQEPPVADPAAGPLAAFRGGASGSAGRVLAFKFGGSSLLGAERMLHAAQLIREAAREASVVVVVSAMKGVTDSLLGIAASVAGGRGSDAIREADHLFYLHVDVLRELRLDPSQAERVASELRFLAKICSTMSRRACSTPRSPAKPWKIGWPPTGSASARAF